MTSHSDKALKTLEMMGTGPTDWHIPPIKWIEKKMEVEGWVQCPDCRGNRCVVIVDGKIVPQPDSRIDYEGWQEYMRSRDIAKCPTCRVMKRSKWFGTREESTGMIKGLVIRIMRVGIIQWIPGGSADSRFADHQSHCQLCAKKIKSAFSWLPLQAKGFDGRVHYMWVGRDCGRKFLNQELKLKDDEILSLE